MLPPPRNKARLTTDEEEFHMLSLGSSSKTREIAAMEIKHMNVVFRCRLNHKGRKKMI